MFSAKKVTFLEKARIVDAIMYSILLFPFSSIIQNYFSPLNLILVGILFALFCIDLLFSKYKVAFMILNCYALLTIVVNFLFLKFQFFNINMPFYFPFLILYYTFFIQNKQAIGKFIINNKKIIDYILITWCFLVFVSFFLPSSYVIEGATKGFASFTTSVFRFCPIAIFILSLLFVQFNLYKNKKYLLLMIIPAAGILFGSTRTYLGVLLLMVIVNMYVFFKKKHYFYLSLIPTLICCAIIVYFSPIWDKFVFAISRNDLYNDFLYSFTSGRSDFWTYDLKMIFSNNLLNISFGNGVNYLFEINNLQFNNPLWAHNDFIQILSDYGLVGLGIYFFIMITMIKKFTDNKIRSKFIMVLISLVWIFNAFFNMFYVYFCAMLSYPIFLYSLTIKNECFYRKEQYERIYKKCIEI